MNSDTICAVATPAGGAIGMIRVAGEQAITVVDKIFTAANGKPLAKAKPYSLTFGNIITESGEVVDEVLVALFKSPHSYTGEDAVEISCHGSAYILQQVMQLLVKQGCRQALPGEYTQRAFLNGKMDLSSAEAVADLIASTSEASHRLAMSQLRGGFSKQLGELRDKLLKLVSLVELELDFNEEDVEFADRRQLDDLSSEVEQLIQKLVQSFKIGNAVKNGVPVAIVGETNSGKSTLLNLLLNEERALVSDICGTTRDAIEDTVNIQGITFRLIDTAGIRETQDTVETMGIRRTFDKMANATLVLWVIDSIAATTQIEALRSQILPLCEGKTLLLLFNKSDLVDEDRQETLLKTYSQIGDAQLFISAKKRENIPALQNVLVKAAAIPQITQNDVIVTNVRHFEALTQALESITRVRYGLADNLSGDFISQDLRECIFHLSNILGEVTTEEVLGEIFSHFCVGK